MSINCFYTLIIEIMNNKLDTTALYIILIVIAIGLLSSLVSCSPRLQSDKYLACYTFKK